MNSEREALLTSFLASEEDVEELLLPISLLEHGKDYTFSTAYQYVTFEEDFIDVVCADLPGDLGTSSLNFEYTSAGDQCSGLTVSIQLSSVESGYWGSVTHSVNWTVVGVNETQTYLDLVEYLAQQSGSSISIDVDLLQPDTQYTFTALLLTGTSVSDTYTTGSFIEYNVDNSHSIRPTEEIAIELEDFRLCLSLETITIDVEVNEEEEDLSGFLDLSGDPKFEIPDCYFWALTDY